MLRVTGDDVDGNDPALRAGVAELGKQMRSATSLLSAQYGTGEAEEKRGGPLWILEHG